MFNSKKIKALEEEIVELKKSLKEADGYEIHLTTAYEDLVDSTSDMRIENASLKSDLTLVKCDLETAVGSIDNLNAIIDDLNDQLQKKDEHIAQLETVVDSHTTVTEHLEKQESIEATNREATERLLQDAKSECDQLRGKLQKFENPDKANITIVVHDIDKAIIEPHFHFNDEFIEQCVESNLIKISDRESQKRAVELLLMTVNYEVTEQLLEQYMPEVNNDE